MTRTLPLVLFLAPLAFGDDKPAPKPPSATTPATAETVIKFPPAPVAPPAVGAPVVLNADELYVVEATGECFFRSFPAGVVKVTKEAGPIRIRAKFAGNANVSTRTFAGPFVYLVEPVATGDTTLVVVPKGVTADEKIKTQAITANVGPRPPPVPPGPTPPGPTPPGPTPPTPQPDPSPFPGTGLRVLMVYETGTTLPVGQGPILFGKEVREYLDAKTPLGPDGKTHEWRIYDKDVTGLENEAATWRDAMSRSRKSVPWLLVGNGKSGYEGPLPATVAETMALLKKFAE